MDITAISAAVRAQLQKPRVLPILITMLVLGTCGIAAFVFRSPEVSLFAASLDSAQLSEVDSRLAAWDIPHSVEADAIRVDTRVRNDILLRLAMVGIPHTHVTNSSEALEKLNALTPDAVFQAQSRAGNAGDIALALRGIDGVLDANVVIAPEVRRPFSDEADTGATAAVRLTLRPGTQLSPAAINGIRTFVASGVPGLKSSAVTLLDDHGFALEAVAPVAQRDTGENLRASLQSAFDQAFGSGSTIVRVHVRYDTTMHAEHQIKRTALNGPALQEDTNDERLQTKERHYDHLQHQAQRGSLIEEAVSQHIGGQPQAIAVAVMVDQTRHLATEQLRAIATATVGLDLLHGDALVIEAMPFLVAPAPFHNPMAAVTAYSGILAVVLASCGFALLAVRCWPPLAEQIQFAKIRLLRRTEFVALPASHEKYRIEDMHRLLRREPLYTAAAVLGRLPAATAATLLELYSSEERTAIVKKMARPASVYLGEWERVINSSAL